jgi:hypothetical protein
VLESLETWFPAMKVRFCQGEMIVIARIASNSKHEKSTTIHFASLTGGVDTGGFVGCMHKTRARENGIQTFFSTLKNDLAKIYHFTSLTDKVGFDFGLEGDFVLLGEVRLGDLELFLVFFPKTSLKEEGIRVREETAGTHSGS